ncbi:MAG: hypothetical protein ABXS93_03285 [Sulfurimonas sp.]
MKIFLSSIVLFVLLLSSAVEIDQGALELQNEAFERAMITFGVAKGLNALISLIQGTELSLTPAGLGMTLTVGEILDPLNDMVERFSWVMLLASISLGIQKLLLILSGKLFLEVALLLSGFTVAVMLWVKQLHHHLFFSYSLKVFVLLIFLRFGAIVFLYLSQLNYTSLLQKEYQSSLGVVENTKSRLESYQKNSNTKISKSEGDFISSIKESYENSLESLNISKQINALEKTTKEAFDSIVVLITIFVVQSLILPLVYIWLLLHSLKFVFRRDLKFDTLKNMYNERY